MMQQLKSKLLIIMQTGWSHSNSQLHKILDSHGCNTLTKSLCRRRVIACCHICDHFVMHCSVLYNCVTDFCRKGSAVVHLYDDLHSCLSDPQVAVAEGR